LKACLNSDVRIVIIGWIAEAIDIIHSMANRRIYGENV